MKRNLFVSLTLILMNFVIARFTNNFYFITFFFVLFSFFFGFFIKNKKELFLSISVYFVITILVSVLEKNDFTRSFFTLTLLSFIALTTGYYVKNKKIIRLIPPIIIILFMLFGFKDYYSFVTGRNYSTIKKMPNIVFYDQNLQEAFLNDKEKVYVLDFWTRSCGSCLKQMPGFEKTLLKYKDNNNIEFYSINIPSRNNLSDNIKFVKEKLNYKFKTLYTKNKFKFVMNKLKRKGVPILLIIKNDTIYYNGALIVDESISVHHINNEIERVLNIK